MARLIYERQKKLLTGTIMYEWSPLHISSHAALIVAIRELISEPLKTIAQQIVEEYPVNNVVLSGWKNTAGEIERPKFCYICNARFQGFSPNYLCRNCLERYLPRE